MDPAELLPLPPFDVEKEHLVGISVELQGDRLKGAVLWLVDCIRQQQKLLESHDQALGSLGGSAALTDSRSASKDERVQSPKAAGHLPKLDQSITRELEGTMKDELLNMQLAKMQHELNTLPKPEDLERLRESVLAELAVLANKTEQSIKEGQDKLNSELSSATDDLRTRLQRIGDDLGQQVDELGKRMAQVEASADQSKEYFVTVEERINIRMESLQGMDFDGSTLAGTSQMLSQMTAPEGQGTDFPDADSFINIRPASPPSADVGAKMGGPASADVGAKMGGPGLSQSYQAAQAMVGSGDLPPGPQLVAAPAPTTPSATDPGTNSMPRLATPVAVQGASTGRTGSMRSPRSSPDGSTMATYSTQDPPMNSGVADQTMSELVSMVKELREKMASVQSSTQRFEIRFEGVVGNIEKMRNGLQENEDKTAQMQADLEAISGSLGDGTAQVDAMRREWLDKAACRKSVDPDGPSTGGRRSPRPRASPREGSKSSAPKSGNVLGHVRAPVLELPQSSDATVSSEEISALHSLVDTMNEKIQSLQQEVQQIAPQMGSVYDTVQDFQRILLPENEPALASIVSNSKRSIAELRKWSSDVDKRLRRIAPLDSQFADVQTELERLRKLFEFVEKVLPSDASKAMSFFNRRTEEPKKEKTMRPRAKTEPNPGEWAETIDIVEETFGPEIAFQQHRETLSEEVRNHEIAMRSEFANLNTAIKNLQRETQQTSNKTGDLIGRIANVESKATALAGKGVPAGPAVQAVQAVPDVPVVPQSADVAATIEQTPSPDPPSEDYVSKLGMKVALDETKNDVRRWLDSLNSTVINALQQKADTNQLNHIMAQLQHAAGAEGLNTETFAMLAKRALLGRCASCDTNFDCDTAKINRPPPVSRPPAWSNQPVGMGSGASQIRPPMPLAGLQASAIAASTAPGRLPKIQDPRTQKDWPKGKIFKSSSSPDVRQVRTLEQND